MDFKFLLTYSKDGIDQFDWFESQEELLIFTEENSIDEIYYAMEVTSYNEIALPTKE